MPSWFEKIPVSKLSNPLILNTLGQKKVPLGKEISLNLLAQSFNGDKSQPFVETEHSPSLL